MLHQNQTKENRSSLILALRSAVTRSMQTPGGQSTAYPWSLSDGFSHAFEWRNGRALSWQLLAVAAVWSFVVALHFGTDGLWYQGDAPRHVTNGLFWLDWLTDLPADPRPFALGYYARYPVIHPTAHPPGFYLLEALSFALFGASPHIAKGLVLILALVATLYLLAWLRCWIAPETGWAAPLLLLQPGVVFWSHTVMLNIPSVAIGMAALLHLRRWIDRPASRQVYPALILTFVGILTYFTTAVVAPIFFVWVLTERRWAILKDRRALVLAPLLAVLLVPWAVIVYHWAPAHVSSLYHTSQPFWNPPRWTYYAESLPELFTLVLLVLAALGIVIGLVSATDRPETKRTAIWIVVSYLAFSTIVAREPRYILPLGPPAIILTVIGLWRLSRWSAARRSANPTPVFLAVIGLLTAGHLWSASLVRVPRVDGFKDVVAYFKDVAPEEMVFYDGAYDGVFSLYMRIGDPDFKRGVILGDKLLYASAIFSNWHLQEYVSSSKDVVERLQAECGCRWLAIEQNRNLDQVAAARYLREAVRGPEFEFIRTFQIDAPMAVAVDVYRFRLPVKPPEHIELSFPSLGDGKRFRVKPIHR